ncbi:NAD-dependent epimerase [Longibacter salinarum]|uniref:NAD-dependent epimerase n=1 Tax=Longibacter salinarum TaxID=1850348 RepID=A0A2A8CW30_9BACT|nr:NAD-dependent epimerase/dehydratase family protein [Longibacter salinarum]PEN12823.1 NAD-dependent epimerase [Longibacter salinarum]
MTQARIFITGGAGFIGRWIAKQCLNRSYDVAVYDNFCAGTPENIAEFASDIDVFEDDILDRAAVQQAMSTFQPTHVFHMAAHHFIPFCNENPDETLRVNVEGTNIVLDVAAQHGVTTAVVASSGAIYPSVDDLISEDLPHEPVDVYGLSKLLTENVCEHVARTTDLQVVAARLFNTYGAYETNPHLIPHIIESLHAGPVVPLGNIHTKRDYIYAEDVAELLIAAAMADLTDRKNGYAVTNVGTGVEYSAEDIIDILRELTGIDITIRQRANRKRSVDKLHQRADTTRLLALTGIRAQHRLEEGLSKLLTHEKLPVIA